MGTAGGGGTRSTVDFLVVGAGIMGCALGYELAGRGARVRVVDAGPVCGGSSGRNAGGVRHQFTNALNVALARRGIERIVEVAAERGADIGLRRVGYLFLVGDPARAAVLRAAVALQNRSGVPTRWIGPDEIAERVPGIVVDDLAGATFCPDDGYLDPHTVVSAYAAGARDRGARVTQFRAVTALRCRGGTVREAVLADGSTVRFATLVNCAGAWAATVAALHGATVPVRPWRSQCYRLTGAELPPDTPMTIDFDGGRAYFHPDSTGLVAGLSNESPVDTPGEVPFEWGEADRLARHLVRRMPAFADASVAGGWAGLLEITPDENPVVGWTRPGGVYTAAGFSGHGLSLAPAVAEDAARELLGEPTVHDLSPFRPERFDGGAAEAAAEVLAMR